MLYFQEQKNWLTNPSYIVSSYSFVFNWTGSSNFLYVAKSRTYTQMPEHNRCFKINEQKKNQMKSIKNYKAKQAPCVDVANGNECRVTYTQPITICFVLMFVFLYSHPFFQFIQLFKMTNLANAYCTAFSMCCQRRASNDERWVLYALFYLICFVLCVFFFSLSFHFTAYTNAWRDDDFSI